jgi:VanZ family protein
VTVLAAGSGAGGFRAGARLAAFHWFPLLVYLGAIHYVSSMPSPPPLLQFRWDKAGHFVEFLLLAVLSSRALHRTFPALALAWVVVISGVFGFLYGTVDEYQQSFVPGRMADILDAVADAAGAFAGAGVYIAAVSSRRRGGEEASE